jgi:hypothetical protein
MTKMPEPPYREGEHTQMALMAQDIKYIKSAVTELKGEVEGKYVTSIEFDPIKRLVYGLVGAVLFAVIAAIMAMVVRT